MQSRKPRFLAAALAALSPLFAAFPTTSNAQAQPASGATAMFPFVIPWDDATPGTATDMSFLSPNAAGDDGYVVARGGHFVTSKRGERIRFLGTNFTFASDFPTHADAEKVAAHLKKMGINIVRIHHHDFNSGKLWDKKFPDHRHIDADARDRLDYLIYQLKRNGVYVDLNLHVSRQFTEADGFPASVNKLKDYDKRVDYFDPKMIELQKEFARDYLTHVNPYTKKSYCDDPCVALIEINNENSLVSDAGTRLAGDLIDLPEPFRGELLGQWNGYLAAKYHDDAALTAAWSAGATALGKSLLADGTAKWTLEHQGETAATLTPERADDGAPGATIDVQKIDATGWHVQAHFAGLNLTEGKTYTVAFQAKVPESAAARTLSVNASLDQADWHRVGLDTSVKVGSAWKTYRAFFTAQNVVAGHCRLTFGLGNQAGTVQIRDVSLQPGVAAPTGGAAGTLAARSIDLPESATGPERADWLMFLEDMERKYADGMRAFLKTDLKTHANICCSQIMWGETAGFYREANMDFADGHAYWEHPSFPGKPWDANNWRIANRPMVTDLVNGGGGTLLRLAEYRVAGKPYTVSEYNEPAPNDYQCETVPELAAFAAAQDWDAIFLFDYGSYGADAANDRIQSFFGIGSNPAKMAFMPAAALIFRQGFHSRFAETITAHPTLSDIRMAAPIAPYWRSDPNTTQGLDERRATAIPTTNALIAVPRFSSDAEIDRSGSKLTLPLGFRTYSDPIKLMSYGTDMTNPWGVGIGYLGSDEGQLANCMYHIEPFGNNFCAFAVTPLPRGHVPNQDIWNAFLVTIIGRVENTGMGWNIARNSVGSNWGKAPTQTEFIPATFTVYAAPGAHVWLLDATGRRVREVKNAHTSNLGITFSTSPEDHTVWYEVGPP